jgi:hypothetical protein
VRYIDEVFRAVRQNTANINELWDPSTFRFLQQMTDRKASFNLFFTPYNNSPLSGLHVALLICVTDYNS